MKIQRQFNYLPIEERSRAGPTRHFAILPIDIRDIFQKARRGMMSPLEQMAEFSESNVRYRTTHETR